MSGGVQDVHEAMSLIAVDGMKDQCAIRGCLDELDAHFEVPGKRDTEASRTFRVEEAPRVCVAYVD